MWDWFQELSSERQYLPSGLPAPITSAQLLAWCKLRNITLQQSELDMLKLLDITLLNTRHKAHIHE